DEKPVLNLTNQDVQQYLIEVANSWLEQLDIDGYHLSNVDQAPEDFLGFFSKEVKAANDTYLQATANEEKDLTFLLEAGFDRISNAKITNALIESFIEPNNSTEDLLNSQLSSTPEKLTMYFDDK